MTRISPHSVRVIAMVVIAVLGGLALLGALTLFIHEIGSVSMSNQEFKVIFGGTIGSIVVVAALAAIFRPK